MPLTMKPLVALIVIGMVLPAHSSDSPAKPDEMDEFCEDVGRSKDPSISPQACDESESRFEYECSASLRDSHACGQAMKAAAGTHEAAECQAALQK